MNTTSVFTFLSSEAGQKFLLAAMQVTETIIGDIATIFKAHAANVAVPAAAETK